MTSRNLLIGSRLAPGTPAVTMKLSAPAITMETPDVPNSVMWEWVKEAAKPPPPERRPAYIVDPDRFSPSNFSLLASTKHAEAHARDALLFSGSFRLDRTIFFLPSRDYPATPPDTVITSLPSLKALREDLRGALRDCGHGELADRVIELSRMHETSDEPELDLASLRELIRAMDLNPKLRTPELTLGEGGFIHAEWRTSEGGVVAMTFYPGSRTEFGAVSEPFTGDRDEKVLRVGGFHHTENAVAALGWHIDRIVSADDSRGSDTR